jgi:hypothetical protein
MYFLWAVLFMVGGITGGELVAWVRGAWVARYQPTMSVEEATDRILAELAEHRRLAEEAMWRIVSDNDD